MNPQPSMPNIAYIISPNFGAEHIELLIKEFNQSKIPFQFQKDHDSLGVVLDRRYFIVVDNLSGSIALGPWFSSLLLFIVGYPRKGSNKKNYYCTSPREVLQKYKYFVGLPSFVRKSFLSSTITEKSVLKSVFSSSLKSNSIAPSQASKKTQKYNQNQIKIVHNESNLSQVNIKAQQNSKLFLFLSVRDTLFNKWLLKIAANNRKKYILTESLQDLSLMLTVNRCVQNFLLIKENQYQTIPKQCLDQLRIIMYTDKSYEGNKEKIMSVCSSQAQIVSTIRKIGFQVLSLKDIDKSIIKYGNPFAKHIKSNTSKKIIWDCQKQNQKGQADLKKQVRSITNKQNGHILNQSEPLTKPEGSDCSVQSKKYTVLRSTSTESAPQGKNKRMSIENDLRHNQEQNVKANCHLEYNLGSQTWRPRYTSSQSILNSPDPLTIVDSSPKQKEQKIMNYKQSVSQTGGKVEQKKIRVKRIKNSQNNSKINDSKNSEGKNSESNQIQSITSNASSVRTSKIFKKKVCQPDLFMSTCEQKCQDKNTRMKRSISISSKTSLVFQQSDRQSDRFSMASSLNNKKDEKKKFTKKCSLKKSHIEAESKLISNTKHQLFQTLRKEYQIFNNVQSCSLAVEKKAEVGAEVAHILLWKQFNFQIENNKNYLKEELKSKKITSLPDLSFYTLDQFRRCIQKNKDKKIFLLIDEEQMYSYMKVLNDSKAKKQVLGVYVFQKMQKNQNSFINGIKTILKTSIFKELRPIVKPVLFNQYFDEGLQAAKQIVSILAHQLK